MFTMILSSGSNRSISLAVAGNTMKSPDKTPQNICYYINLLK